MTRYDDPYRGHNEAPEQPQVTETDDAETYRALQREGRAEDVRWTGDGDAPDEAAAGTPGLDYTGQDPAEAGQAGQESRRDDEDDRSQTERVEHNERSGDGTGAAVTQPGTGQVDRQVSRGSSRKK